MLTRLRSGRSIFAAAALGLVTLAGCGGKADNSATATAETESSATPLPTASIGDDKQKSNETTAAAEEAPLEPGTPHWLLKEMVQLRLKPILPEKEQTDVEKLRVARRERNLKIIELAEEAIAKSHNDPALEEVFTASVHQLLESRLQLAMQGKQEDIEELYNVAALMHKRDPKSAAACEAAHSVVQLATSNAHNFPQQRMQWLTEASRQARLFAVNFPQDATRAASLLYATGWSCELHRLNDEAIACYGMLQQRFPQAPQAQQAVGILRRLQLPGRPLELAGPTIDGGFVRINDYKGRVVLVTFWASDITSFQEQAPLLSQLYRKHEKAGLSVIGVNLDEEESAVDAFMERAGFGWPQLFDTDRQKRRWNHPIVRYYGVRDIPAYWLVDRNGLVVDTNVDPANLEKQVTDLLNNVTPPGKTPAAGSKGPQAANTAPANTTPTKALTSPSTK